MVKELFVFFVCSASVAWAGTKPDFSGDYGAQQKKADKTTASLRVVQTDSAIQVTRVYGAKTITNSFPLNGSEGDYTMEMGVRGKCRAQLRDDILMLEWLVASPSNANTPSIRFDTREEWRLSGETKTLIIK